MFQTKLFETMLFDEFCNDIFEAKKLFFTIIWWLVETHDRTSLRFHKPFNQIILFICQFKMSFCQFQFIIFNILTFNILNKFIHFK